MKLSDFSIKNYQFTLVIFFLLTAIGISAYQNIPRTEDPYFDISAFRINVIYPGADPREMEQQVAKPIEDALRSLDDLKEMLSTSRNSGGVVFVRFDAEVDVDKKFDEVNRELNSIRDQLPAGIQKLEIERINPGFTNIIQYSLVSETASYADLANYAEDLSEAFERISSVRESESWAYPEQQVRVSLNFKKLAELGIQAADVARVIQGESLNIPGGPVEEGARRLNVQTSGQYRSVEEIRNTVIAGTGTGGDLGGRLVRVGDVADVQWDYENQEVMARFNGQRAVFVTANQKDERNIFVTQKALQETADEFEKTLPPNIKMERGFEQYKNVEKRIDRLTFDFALAVTLVLITLLPLGLRASGIVMVSVPLSLLTGLACLYYAGFSLNQLSIAGLVVALGLLVDDSIVVIENISRYLRMGYNRVDAARLATKQISLAVVGCTATLLFAFLPLLMLPDNAGKFIRSLPVAVVFTVIASLFVALTIIPFLASRVLKKDENEHGNIVLQKLMGLIDKIYTPLLHRALQTPKTVVAASLVLFVASLGLAPLMGMSLFPKANTPQFVIEVGLPPGSSLTATDNVVKQVENKLSEFDEITAVMATVGEGNPQIYYNVFQQDKQSNVGELFVQLKEYNDDTPKLLDNIRNELKTIAGANLIVREFENGPPIDAPIGIRLVGPEIETLRELSAQVERIMLANPGTQNVDNPQRTGRSDLRLKVNFEKAGLLGVNSAELDQAVRLAIAGAFAGEIRQSNGDAYDISVRGPAGVRSNLSALDDFHVISRTGQAVPLTQLTTLELDDNLNSIYRFDRERAVLLTAYTRTGYNTEKISNEIAKQIDEMGLPTGYRYKMAGEVKSRQESFAGFGTAILITVFGILAILVLEFGSFKSTLIVLFVIPLGVTGGMVMLFLTGNSLSFTAMIGFIALIGIEIKNSILLVDFTNQLREEGKGLDESIEEAGRIRFLPILLTSATAVGGLMPLALQGGGLYSPMAWVIIGGLISSTFIGRLVTPVLYKLLPPDLQRT
ncbi:MULTISPECIES: efflux RND transporter permease subunit [Limnobacter]|jgi:multidrug efflux pump subunit AcrB|uniref:Efflux RND transporter permease subunit n=2 Tax=Limnobacter TaxID=131079 RepID=A0ABX6N4R3_9BURK|nr:MULTISPECIES: efflux RND transporter permease subunit [unclassified Limnobacter]EDM83925.1 AcrB/AcrD/AcrF family protein [Limnobacter sp. MED105]QJR28734.1 efflux RND transporter permease subunit [Limnobacter sp. SAORIC-580]